MIRFVLVIEQIVTTVRTVNSQCATQERFSVLSDVSPFFRGTLEIQVLSFEELFFYRTSKFTNVYLLFCVFIALMITESKQRKKAKRRYNNNNIQQKHS